MSGVQKKKPISHEFLLTLMNSGGAIIVGGPAFIYWVSPTDEELFQKYNPDLQRKSLERRFEKQQEFDDFVMKLKDYSKSDKPSRDSSHLVLHLPRAFY